jgi:quercetin dioxygenase-like cupin family protein
MRSIQKWCLLALAGVIAPLIVGPTFAQQSSAPAFKVTPLLKESLTGQPDKEVVMVLIEWPPGAGTGRHAHSGDEYATILEGAITGQKEGADAKTFNSGESYHSEAGVVHEAKNSGNQPAKTVNLFVVEKGKPLVQPVK